MQNIIWLSLTLAGTAAVALYAPIGATFATILFSPDVIYRRERMFIISSMLTMMRVTTT